jgi:hypothetical protein
MAAKKGVTVAGVRGVTQAAPPPMPPQAAGPVGVVPRVPTPQPPKRKSRFGCGTVLGITLLLVVALGVVGNVLMRQEQKAADRRLATLVEEAEAALTARDVPKARVAINEALNLKAARTRLPAEFVNNAMNAAEDREWALNCLAKLSNAELEAFKNGGKAPESLDLKYPVLTEKAAANAREQIDAVPARRAKLKQDEEDAAEAKRQRAAAEAEAATQKADAEAAQKAAALKEITEKQDALLNALVLLEANTIASVNVERRGESWKATLMVKDIWHVRHYQVRLQDAQTLWKTWAMIASPKEMDNARIVLVDGNGNEVGGSRALAGSLIWVQEK